MISHFKPNNIMAQNTTIQNNRIVRKAETIEDEPTSNLAKIVTGLALLLSIGSLIIQYNTMHTLHFGNMSKDATEHTILALLLVSGITDLIFGIAKFTKKSLVTEQQKRHMDMVTIISGGFVAFGIIGRFYVSDAILITSITTISSIALIVWLGIISNNLDPIEQTKDKKIEARLQAEYTEAFKETSLALMSAELVRETERRAKMLIFGIRTHHEKHFNSPQHQERLAEYSEKFDGIALSILNGADVSELVSDHTNAATGAMNETFETEVKQLETILKQDNETPETPIETKDVEPLLNEIRALQREHNLDADEVAEYADLKSITRYIETVMNGTNTGAVGYDLAFSIRSAMRILARRANIETEVKQHETPAETLSKQHEIEVQLSGDSLPIGFRVETEVKQSETDVKQHIVSFEEKQRLGSVSMRDIAQQTGVSPATVLRTLKAYRQNHAILTISDGVGECETA